MNKETYIYGLYSADAPDIIRYVGKADNPEDRLSRHIRDTKLSIKKFKKLTHKENWIKKSGYMIGLKILETCKYLDWPMIEKSYIANIPNLTNSSKGGKGGGPIKFTLSHDEAKNWVSNNLSCKSKTYWNAYVKSGKIPDFIPMNPWMRYKECGWVSWGDFLGNDNIFSNNIDYVSLNEAIEILKPIGINSSSGYKKMHKSGEFKNIIPYRPERYYHKLNRGWTSWSDFLSNCNIANQNKKFVTLPEFIEFCESRGICKNRHFRKFMKESADELRKNLIPTNPNITYIEDWLGWDKLDIMKKN